MINAPVSACETFQRAASAWLRSGELNRTNHVLSTLEEFCGYNFGFVYLLDGFTSFHSHYVKIGYSEHPVRRLRELRPLYGETLKIRACFIGELRDEREVHRRFAHLRAEYELFLDHPAIDAYFAEMRERAYSRVRAIHLCSAECPQIVRGLDLRMLRSWLER